MLDSLDHVLGTTAKVRLLRALLPLESPASGREAERLAEITHRSAVRALEDLVSLGVLERTTTRATHLYRINREHDLVPLLEALYRGESARLASLGNDIENALTLGGLTEMVESVVLFGSSARGDAQPGSDLDLLVLVKERSQKEEAVSSLLGATSDPLRTRYGFRPSILGLSIQEARRRIEDDDPLLEEILRDGRTLYGTGFQEALGVW